MINDECVCTALLHKLRALAFESELTPFVPWISPLFVFTKLSNLTEVDCK